MLHEITQSPVPRILTVMNFVMLPLGVSGVVQPFFIGKGATLQSPEFCSTVYLGEHCESLSCLTDVPLMAKVVSCYPKAVDSTLLMSLFWPMGISCQATPSVPHWFPT